MEYSIVIACSIPQTLTVRLIASEGGVDVRITNSASDGKIYLPISHRIEGATLASARAWADEQAASYQAFCTECEAVLAMLTAVLDVSRAEEVTPAERALQN